VGKLGLSICYDLRFPEQYVALTKLGAEVLLIPAAFTATTGKAHWETLLRARAIENQCYVAAAAQYGVHNIRRHSHGEAMIIDPWGAVVARCSDGVGIAVADVDLDYLADVRGRIPCPQHRRPEVYGDVGSR
jgi:predicted amidohydrolase